MYIFGIVAIATAVQLTINLFGCRHQATHHDNLPTWTQSARLPRSIELKVSIVTTSMKEATKFLAL